MPLLCLLACRVLVPHHYHDRAAEWDEGGCDSDCDSDCEDHTSHMEFDEETPLCTHEKKMYARLNAGPDDHIVTLTNVNCIVPVAIIDFDMDS